MARGTKRYARIEPARELEIASLAEGIADHYCPTLPVRPEVVFDAHHVPVTFNDYGDAYDGLLEQRGGEFHVFCNLTRVEARGSARCRFTLGHELGHFSIDEHRNALLAGSPRHNSQADFTSNNPIEAEADLFSSSLLLPESRFRPRATREEPSLQGILRLASTFETSVTSTAIRYARLGIKPCAIIRWASDKSYAWKWLSPQLFRETFWTTIENVDDVPPDSPTGEVLHSADPSVGVISKGSTTAAWFRFVRAGSYRDLLLMEHAMSLGRFGALTMLVPLDETLRT